MAVRHWISVQEQIPKTRYFLRFGLVLFPLLLWPYQPVTQWPGCVLIHAVAHLNLAQLLERRGHYEEAVSLYRRCSRLNGAGLKDPRTHEATKISALLHLGRMYADQGRLHKAVAMYQEAVDKMPGHYPPQVSIQFDSNSEHNAWWLPQQVSWHVSAVAGLPYDNAPALGAKIKWTPLLWSPQIRWDIILYGNCRYSPSAPITYKNECVLNNMFDTCEACGRAERKHSLNFLSDVTKNYVNWNILN